MFRQEDIDRLMEQLNIVDVVGEFIDLKKSGANYKGICPFHADTNPSFSVNPQKNICKCFVCGAGGNPITFYAKYKKIGFVDAVRELSRKYKIPIQETRRNPEEDLKYERYYSLMEKAHEYFQKNIFKNVGREALAYLSKRKVSPKLIKENNLGYASSSWEDLYNYLTSLNFEPEELELLGLIKKNEVGKYYDVFRNRIIFPIYSMQGRVIAFGGRSLENKKEIPKYINSSDTPIFKKGKGLYGLERVQNIKKKNYAILMEGYMDVLSTVSFGFDTAVAPLGTALTEEQTSLLKRYTENVILSFDADNAGQMAAERAVFILKQEGFNIRILELKGAKDPDEFLKKFGKEAFLKQIQESLEAFDFLFQYYRKEYSLDNIMSKQKFIERFQDFFDSLSKEVEKELYLQKFSSLLEMEADILKQLLFSKKAKKIHTRYTEKTIEGEQKQEKSLDSLEELSIQTIFLDLESTKFWKNARYYQFLKEMSYENSLSQKIFHYLLELEKKNDEEALPFEKEKLLSEAKSFLTSFEQDLLFDIITKCLDRKKIEEERGVLCRGWLRKIFQKRKEISLEEKPKLNKLKRELLRNTFELENFLKKYHQYLKMSEEK